MYNIEEVNLILAEICINISEKIVSSDELFLRYKTQMDLVEVQPEYSFVLPNKILTKMALMTKSLLNSNEQSVIEEYYEEVLSKINTLITPINVQFYKNYFIGRITIESGIRVKDKIIILEKCINNEPMNDVLYNCEFYSMLLNIYLTDIPDSMDKVKSSSTKLKSIIAIRNDMPINITDNFNL